MKYRDIEIIANVKKYQQFTLDKEGKPEWLHYDFEGVDVISYTTDEYPDVEFDTLKELKSYLDKELTPIYVLDCADCETPTRTKDGRFYKYEPSIWLCGSCHDDRMEN